MKILEVRNLLKIYRGRTVVDNVDFTVERGIITGLLGQNGAGKTTIFKIIMGLVTPNRGQVLFFGTELTKYATYQRARMGLTYLPQENSTFRDLTVVDNLMVAIEAIQSRKAQNTRLSIQDKKSIIEETLTKYGLAKVAHNKAYTLSGGEARRLEIARTMLLKPKLLLLDEPFSGIDPKACEEIREIIKGLKQEDVSVLLTDHNVYDTLKTIDRGIIIYDGKIIAEGTPREIVANSKVRSIYLGQSFCMSY